MTKETEIGVVLEDLAGVLQKLMDHGRDSLDVDRQKMAAAAAAAPGETEYVVVVKMRAGAALEGAMHIVKRLEDAPAIISPIFGFCDGGIAAAVVMPEDDDDPDGHDNVLPFPRLH
ncbi:hypothetical protein [Parvibaculum sp.]|uniref:hypothetical protein n=1 Tax=Parvibaculum sp. TaxID=2024848 RepID=UPI00391AAB0B